MPHVPAGQAGDETEEVKWEAASVPSGDIIYEGTLSSGAYIILRRKNRYLGSVAGVLSIIFAAVFLVSLLMRS